MMRHVSISMLFLTSDQFLTIFIEIESYKVGGPCSTTRRARVVFGGVAYHINGPVSRWIFNHAPGLVESTVLTDRTSPTQPLCFYQSFHINEISALLANKNVLQCDVVVCCLEHLLIDECHVNITCTQCVRT